MPGLIDLPAIPDGDWAQTGWTIFGGAVSRYLAVGDNNSATGIQATVFGSVYTATVGSPGLPAGTLIAGITAEARCYYVGPGRVDVVLLLVWLPTLAVIAQSAPLPLGDTENTGVMWQTPGALARPDGQPFTEADIANNVLVQVQAYTYGGATCKVTQLQVGVWHNQPPTIVATTPAAAATLTFTAQPALGGTYTDPEGDPIEQLHIKVFSGTGAVDPVFETARLVYEWVGFANAFSHTLTTSLTNQGYRWAARAADAGSGGRFSDWVQSTFTVNVPAPGPPTVSSAVWDPAGQRVALTTAMPAIGSGAMPDWYEMEQSKDAGVTWELAMDRFPLPNAVPLVGSMVLSHQDPADANRYWALDTNGAPLDGPGSGIVEGTGDLIVVLSLAAGDVIVRQAAGFESVVTAGRTYRIWSDGFPQPGSRNFAVSVDWLNAGGGTISSATGPNTLMAVGGGAPLTPFDATAPAGAVKARLRLIMRAAASSNELAIWAQVRMVDTSVVVYDDRAWRKASVQVRIRSKRRPGIWSTESSPPSAWVTNTVVTTSDGKTWLKSFATPSLNGGYHLAGDSDVESASDGRLNLAAVWGQRAYTPSFAVPLGWRSGLVLSLATDAELDALERLYRAGGVVLWMSDKGETPRRQLWVSIANLSMVEGMRSVVGTVERQWRTVRLDLAEAPDPLTVV